MITFAEGSFEWSSCYILGNRVPIAFRPPGLFAYDKKQSQRLQDFYLVVANKCHSILLGVELPRRIHCIPRKRVVPGDAQAGDGVRHNRPTGLMTPATSE